MRIRTVHRLLCFSFFLLASFTLLQAQISVSLSTTPSCNGNGTLTANVVGGTPPFTYQWWGPNFNVQTTGPTITGLQGGYYYMYVTDVLGQQAWASVTLARPFEVALMTTNDNCSAGIGSASVQVLTGGTPPFTYQWSNGGTSSTISGLSAGTYEFTVTDAQGCWVSSASDSSWTAYIQNASPITFQVNTTGSTCNDGTATVTNIQNGTPPYTFFWNTTPPQTTQTATALPGWTSGTVTVTDAVGCVTSNWYWVNQLPNGLNVNFNVVDETCVQANGSVQAFVSGGVPPYTYQWSNGATTSSISGLSYDNYILTVTDANQCPDIKTATVDRLDPLTLNMSSVDPGCANNNGQASVLVVGGTAPYTYQWNLGGTGSSISGLAMGYYSVSVTDAQGCSDLGTAYLELNPNCYGTVSGRVVNDLNADCVNDPTDIGFPYRYVLVGNHYAVTDGDGDYVASVLPGTHTVSQLAVPNYFALGCPSAPPTYTVTNLQPQQTVGNLNFYNQASSSVNDLYLSLYASPARVTTTQIVQLYYQNNGSTLQNVVVNYVHDPLMTLDIGGPALTGYNPGTRTCTYNVGPVYPGQGGYVYSYFSIPVNTPVGTPYVMYGEVLPIAGDATPTNNVVQGADQVVAAYDPNDKQVYPAGNITHDDSVLTYTVRFQNTGNDTAFNVLIRDTIDTDLDMGSLQVVGASHPFVLSGETPGVAVFHFQNIMLPDSNINEPASHGHIIYRIKLKPSLPWGTQIHNSAAIYFDYNAPIITNTTLNTLAITSSEDGLVTEPEMLLFPNPGHDRVHLVLGGAWSGLGELEVTDLSGRSLHRESVEGSDGQEMELSLGHLPRGIYLVSFTSMGHRVVKKLALQ